MYLKIKINNGYIGSLIEKWSKSVNSDREYRE